MNLSDLVEAEMAAYSDGEYSDHGSARDSLTHFAATVRDACARHLELTRSDVLLMTGEMSAQEVRTVMAVLSCIWKRMRSNAEVSGDRRESAGLPGWKAIGDRQ